MKKILVAAAIVCAAACVQAASLNWMVSAVPTSSAFPSAEKTTYTAYLFLTAAAADYGVETTSLTAIKTALGSNSSFSTFADTYAAVNGTALNAAGGLTGATGFNGNNFGSGDSLSAYVVILDNSIASAKNYIISSEKSVTWGSASGAQQLTFGSQAAATWNTVGTPEPTSGMLLLLGMAGLALKRKRA